MFEHASSLFLITSLLPLVIQMMPEIISRLLYIILQKNLYQFDDFSTYYNLLEIVQVNSL